MRALGRELDEVFQPELRYSTDLLDIAPAGTVVYFAMPNISDELGQAYELLQDRVATSVVLRSGGRSRSRVRTTPSTSSR